MKITDDNFDQEVLGSAKPVVVLFWKPGCLFCKMLLKVLEQIGPNFPNVKFRLVNEAGIPKIKQRYAITAYPVLCVVKDGKVVDQRAGFADFGNIFGWIKERIA